MKLIYRYDNWGGVVINDKHDSLIPFIQASLYHSERKHSKTEVKRLITERAVKLNGVVVVGTELVSIGDELQVGKKIWFKFNAKIDLINTLCNAENVKSVV